MNNFLTPLFPALVDAAVKATILLGLAWVAGALLKNRPAALRHTVRACALSGVLVLPILSSVAPAWHWKVVSQLLPAEQETAVSAVPTAAAPVVHESVSGGASAATQPANTPPNYKSGLASIAGSRVAPQWPPILMMVWLLGTALGAFRLLASRSRFAAVINKAAPVHDLSWSLQLKEISYLLGIRRSVALLESKDTEVPLTAGAFYPKVILSPDYSEWSPLRRNAILHHELAHVRRWDILAQALCQLALAMYWFHPLVWLTVRTMRAEREQACDDHVVAAGTRPSEYAHELLEIASSLHQPEFTAALALARRSQLEGRVMALLNPRQQRGSISRKTTLATALLTLCAVLPLAAFQAAAPRDKNTKHPQPAIPAPAQSAPPAKKDANIPPETQAPEAASEPALPPVEGIPGGIREGVPGGGIEGGVQGGVHEGVRRVPPVPPHPPSAPVAPIPPDAKSPVMAPLPSEPPVAPLPDVAPAPRRPRAAPAPAPRPVPRPEGAPVAPAVPLAPGVVSPAPTPAPVPRIAATAAMVKALRAQLATRPVPGSQDIETLRAEIAALAATASSSAPEIARLRAQSAAIAAQAAPMSKELAALQAELANLAAIVPKAAACISSEAAALQAQIAVNSNRQLCQKHD